MSMKVLVNEKMQRTNLKMHPVETMKNGELSLEENTAKWMPKSHFYSL